LDRRKIILTYLIVAAVLFVVEAALLLVHGLVSDSELNPFQRVSEVSTIVGPLVVSWRLAVRMRQALSDAELLAAAFWCVAAQLIADIAGTGVAFLAAAFDEFDTSWLTPELVPTILFAALFAAIVRYLLVYLLVWVVLRFPGRWLAITRLRHLDVAA
jgi:hypothetical protein